VSGRHLLAAGSLLAGLVSCAPHVPGIADPLRVDAHCSPREARITGIRSILTSTNDVLDDDRPTRNEVREAVAAGDGAIAYWNDQLLLLPKSAARFGESDGFVRVRAAGIPPAPAGATYRHLYLDVRDHGTYRWVTLQAFDLQDICIEGHKQG
jgi:hypothetical protein